MEQQELAAAISSLLKTLQDQLAAAGARSETLGPIQSVMLKGYIAEYLAIHHDPVLEGVLRGFPERPTLLDAVAVLQQMARARPAAVPASRPGTGDAPQPDVASELGARLLGFVTRLSADVRRRLNQALSQARAPARDDEARINRPAVPEGAPIPVQLPMGAEGPAAADDYEAEKQLWLSTIPQTRGGVFDNEVPAPSQVPGLKRLRRVVGLLVVGVTAAIGTGAPRGFLSIPRWTAGDVATFVAFAVSFAFAFEVLIPWLKPWVNTQRAARGLPPVIYPRHDHPFRSRGLRGLMTGFLISLALEAVWHVSGHGTNRILLFTVVPLAGTVTWFWMAGTESGRRQAAVLGAKSGVIAGCLLGYVLAGIAGPSIDMFHTVLASGLRGGLVGYAGGLALDRGWGSEPRGMVKALVGASVLWWLLVAPFIAADFLDFLSGTLAAAGFGVGWAIGVSDWRLRSPLQSLAFRGSTAPTGP